MGAAEKLDRGQRTDCPGTSNDTETTTTAKWKRDPDVVVDLPFALSFEMAQEMSRRAEIEEEY
jgi:hypothetical protein